MGLRRNRRRETMAFLNLGGGVEVVAADRVCLGLFRTKLVVSQILKRSSMKLLLRRGARWLFGRRLSWSGKACRFCSPWRRSCLAIPSRRAGPCSKGGATLASFSLSVELLSISSGNGFHTPSSLKVSSVSLDYCARFVESDVFLSQVALFR